MRATPLIVLGAAACLLACGRGNGLYSKHSPQLASAPVMQGPQALDGRWARTVADCVGAAWTVSASGLEAPNGLHCSFAKLNAATAGFGADTVCKGAGAERIGWMTMTLSGQGASRGLTLAGGPFPTPVALARCPAG